LTFGAGLRNTKRIALPISISEHAMPTKNPSVSHSNYASIVVEMGPDTEAEARAKLAANLADRFDSRLIGIAAMPVFSPLYFESAVEGVTSITEIEERQASRDIATAESIFRRVAGARDRVEWRYALKFPLDFILDQAAAADLIVASRSRNRESPIDPAMTMDGGDLVMSAGRPVLFVPPRVDHLSAKRIVIAWKNTREARRTMRDGLPLLKGALEVLVVSVGGNDESAKHATGYLQCHSVSSSVISQPRSTTSVADEVIRIAQQEGADLIVCGAYGHSRAREWIFGGVTRDLLDHSPLCCLMSH
jgi:nucleotide-binding universal stress UspA family protein